MSAVIIPNLKMSNGKTIPQLGFGTYKISPDQCSSAVISALELGIRHLDTAQMYHNEAEVGQAIRSSSIPRQEIFLTTKLNNCNHLPDDARRSFDQSLKDLQTDYVDLFLIHWPLPTRYDGNFVQTWQVMLEFAKEGRAKTVGVSNFQIHHLQRLIAETGVTPAVNQIEVHPHLPNNELRRFHQQHQVITQAWSPLGRGKILQDPQLLAQSKRLGRTPAQVALRWAIERGDVVFPKSVHVQRIKENLQLFDFQLDAEATQVLNSLDRGEAGRTGSHPDKMDLIDL